VTSAPGVPPRPRCPPHASSHQIYNLASQVPCREMRWRASGSNLGVSQPR
jgi:hypothetical protein